MDFGSDWADVPCSDEFKQVVSKALELVGVLADNGDVMAFNINGSLSQSCNGVCPLNPVRHIKMPSTLFDIRIKNGTKACQVICISKNSLGTTTS